MKLKALLLCALAITSFTVAHAQDDEPTRSSHHNKAQEHYGRSVLSISPVTITDAGVEGFGIAFETALDKRGLIAFSLPLVISINKVDGTNYGVNPYYGSTVSANYGVFCAYPGIKIYPRGSFGMFRYSVGPNFVIESGSTGSYDNNTSTWTKQSLAKFGIMVTNSLNINPSPKFYCGIDFGFGITYVNTVGGVDQGVGGLARLAFSLGYRF